MLPFSKQNIGAMSINDLKRLEAKMKREKKECKQKEMVKKHEMDMEVDTDIRKRVNQELLKYLLENTQFEEDPQMINLHSKLKAYVKD